MKIPVIINNRNLLTWPRAMVEKIETFDNVGDIIIIDNGSTYNPLLHWYNTINHTVIYMNNTGHRAPWLSGVIEKLDCEYYVVTDPDLDLTECPTDALVYLEEKIRHTGIAKLGIDLHWQNVKPGALYYDWMQSYECRRRLTSRIINEVMVDVAIDTTFAIYPKSAKEYFIGGGSTMPPYRAKHIPWNYTREEIDADPEFSYYLNNANQSCSMLQWLK